MHESTRRTIFNIASGDHRNFPFIHGLGCLKNGINLLRYCESKKIVGERFYRMFEDNKFSPIRVASYLLKKIHSDKNRKITWSDIRG